jgi:transcriptional regulator with XRE-family HTH domain
MSSAFAALMRLVIEQYEGSKTEFAREAGITPSAVSRLLAGAFPPPCDVCLRIAKAAHIPPSRVLKAAGHEHTAALLEELYGAPRVAPRAFSTAEERWLVEEWRALDDRTRRAFRILFSYRRAADTAAVAALRRRLDESVHGITRRRPTG